jgi:hypothetical protein
MARFIQPAPKIAEALNSHFASVGLSSSTAPAAEVMRTKAVEITGATIPVEEKLE